MKRGTAFFYFYGAANVFIQNERNKQKISIDSDMPVKYFFKRNPSIKDAIENLGSPHTEIVAIVVNSKPENFDYLLHDQDVVNVYSFDTVPDVPADFLLPNRPEGKPAFILDVHLGGLARYLRFCGFDTLYDIADPGDIALASISDQASRILLTRDIGLLKHAKIRYGHWLRNTDPKKQLIEVNSRYQLNHFFKPFSRCSLCNGLISEVDKKQLKNKISTSVYNQFERFWECESCGQIYWKGKHYSTIKKEINELINKKADQAEIFS